MKRQHSTVSRRDFMKALGLGTAGAAGLAAAAPVIHDLDELLASESPSTKTHSQWWVKERDFEDATTEIDWGTYKRRVASERPMPPGPYGPTGMQHYAGIKKERNDRLIRDIQNNTPGSSLRDNAVYLGCRAYSVNHTAWDSPPMDVQALYGVPKWKGTPEENLQLVRAAFRFFGAPKVGCLPNNAHMQSFFDKDGIDHNYNSLTDPVMNMVYRSEYENIQKPYIDEERCKHIPSSFPSIITWIIKQNVYSSSFSLRTNEDEGDNRNHQHYLGAGCVRQAYGWGNYIRVQVKMFMQALGYWALSMGLTNGTSSNPPLGIYSGLGEQGRPAYLTSPLYGNGVRETDCFFTDMEVAPTKPIDAGILNFCKVCKRCAENCPNGAITEDDDISWDDRCEGNNPGYNGWKLDWWGCTDWGGPDDCQNCLVVCPFNHADDAILHPIVRATAGTTSLFNGFFATMDRYFAYGRQRTENEINDRWWGRDTNKFSQLDVVYGFPSMVW